MLTLVINIEPVEKSAQLPPAPGLLVSNTELLYFHSSCKFADREVTLARPLHPEKAWLLAYFSSLDGEDQGMSGKEGCLGQSSLFLLPSREQIPCRSQGVFLLLTEEGKRGWGENLWLLLCTSSPGCQHYLWGALSAPAFSPN